MNAKMIITVPIEEIPSEVKRILNGISSRLQAILEETKETINSDDHLTTINKIDNIRKKLSVIDLNYEDCCSVLSGYVKYKAEKTLSEQTREKNNERDNNDSNNIE